MRTIRLTTGENTLVDNDTYKWARHWKWKSNKGYAYHYMQVDQRRCSVHLANLIMGGLQTPKFVDHIDGNPLNNQRSNLRIVTVRQNGQNMKIHRNGHLCGTTYQKSSKRWFAKIKINGIRKHLGCYRTAQEAHNAYLKAVAELE